MKIQKPLTKSRFKVALECPTKLYYLDKEEYANANIEDSFLEALAEGGFQVGALAKCYYPDGVEITERDYVIPIEKTNELLKRENVVIFEAAFRYKDFFVRTDVLEKKGNKIRLMEVKAKSFDPYDSKKGFLSKKFINKSWADYLYDVAFQKYVVENSFKERKVTPLPDISAYLTLADKSKCASIDGLNQKFLVLKDKNRNTYLKITGDVSTDALGEKMLTEQPVDEYLEMIFSSKEGEEYLGAKFEDYLNMLSDYFKKDKKIPSPIGRKCKDCEFVTDKDDKSKKSGFEECWKEQAKFKKMDFEKQLVYNVWNYRGSEKMIESKKYFMEDLKKSDFDVSGKIEGPKISNRERQWLQVEKYKNKDSSPFILKDELKKEMEGWKYPLHFIDFETTAVALPFNKGIRPYEGLSFQFSHHTVDKDGTIEHKGQYINDRRGVFPSYEFVRVLKNELDKDEGTIFRYAVHENTYLNIIYRQLKTSDEADKIELMKWIQSITKPAGSTEDEWESPRNMVDMCEVVKDFHYDPYTNGSNSIKKVLPAVLNSSEYLQKKYSKPIYGAVNGIKSLNFKDWVWIKYDEDKKVKDPYELLPPVFDKETDEKLNDEEMLNKIFGDEPVRGGGEAMMAYAKMQFSEMTAEEKERLKISLLKYCELDTFAMVLIWEYWKSIIK